MQNVTRICWVPFYPHCQISSSTFLYLTLFLPLFPTLFLKQLVMYVAGSGLWMFLDGLCIYAFIPLLVKCVTCLCVTRMANIITLPCTWVFVIISSITALEVIASTLDFNFRSPHPFRWWQKGEDECDLISIGFPSLSWLLNSCFLSCVWIE